MSTEWVNRGKVYLITAIVGVLIGLSIGLIVKKPDSTESDRQSKVDVVFAVDVSGSMCAYRDALMPAIDQAVRDFSGADHRFALVAFPTPHISTPPYETFIGLANAADFSVALDLIGCGWGSGYESSYDVVLALADPADPAGIGWRTDAVPILIMVSDEPGQSLTALAESDVEARSALTAMAKSEVAARVASCSLPGCRPGASLQMFILTPDHVDIRESWDEVVADDPDRLMRLENSEDHLLGRLRTIFRNRLRTTAF